MSGFMHVRKHAHQQILYRSADVMVPLLPTTCMNMSRQRLPPINTCTLARANTEQVDLILFDGAADMDLQECVRFIRPPSCIASSHVRARERASTCVSVCACMRVRMCVCACVGKGANHCVYVCCVCVCQCAAAYVCLCLGVGV